MMKKRDEKGFALIMVLTVVLIMTTIAVHLHSNERGNMLTAAAMRDRSTLEQMTISVIHLAMAVLTQDAIDNKSDSLQEDWADEEIMKTLIEQLKFDQGKLSVTIMDELSKIQINALIEQPENQYDADVTQPSQFKKEQKAIWDRLAGQMIMAMELLGEDFVDMEDLDKDAILIAIKDWLDKDDFPSSSENTESDYYEDLDPPYKCKNGPIDHLSEVQLIKGITPELFNGFGEIGGLGDYITIYGAIDLANPPKRPMPNPENAANPNSENAGRPNSENAARPAGPATENKKYDYPGLININTADLTVLTALMSVGSEGDAQTLIAFREAKDNTQYVNQLTDISWPSKAIPESKGLEDKPITISSDTFRITATAELDGAKATTTVVIKREKKSESSPWQCKVLNWETE